MKFKIIILVLISLFTVFSCKTQKATSKTKTDDSGKPPFAVKDSSKVLNLEGGVKVYVIKEGEGNYPTLSSKVLANYHGRLKNGQVFDSSYERGQATEFPLSAVIKGWQVAFQKMKPGSRFVLVIPPSMGYGTQAVATIPANSTLIFDCDFISFQ